VKKWWVMHLLSVNAAVLCKTIMIDSHNFELARLKEKKITDFGHFW